MVLRIAMDVNYQLTEVSRRANLDPTKGALKQSTGTRISPVKGLGIGTEQIGKSAAWIQSKSTQRLFIFDAHQQVEVIAQQAVGERVDNRRNMIRIQLHEVPVIPRFPEDVFTVVATAEDVVGLACQQ